MGHHLTKAGGFKSDKYAWCPEGFFALKISTDPDAQAAALFYADLVEHRDPELARDLRKSSFTYIERADAAKAG